MKCYSNIKLNTDYNPAIFEQTSDFEATTDSYADSAAEETVDID
jgi:hypothetical protein